MLVIGMRDALMGSIGSSSLMMNGCELSNLTMSDQTTAIFMINQGAHTNISDCKIHTVNLADGCVMMVEDARRCVVNMSSIEGVKRLVGNGTVLRGKVGGGCDM